MENEDIKNYLISANSPAIKRIFLNKNSTIIEQDSKAEDVFYMIKGLAKAFNVNEFANEFLFGIYGNDEFFGELEFFTGIKYYNNVETITECELLKIPHHVFDELLKENNNLFMELAKKLADRLYAISKRAVEYSYFPAEYLLSKFLYHEAINGNTKEIMLSKEDTANYLGTNIRTINRVLKKFNDKNLITINKNKIRITDINNLCNIFKSFNK